MGAAVIAVILQAVAENIPINRITMATSIIRRDTKKVQAFLDLEAPAVVSLAANQ